MSTDLSALDLVLSGDPGLFAIVRKAAQNDYRFSSFVTGIVNSAAFQMSKAEPVVTTADAQKDK